MLMDGWTPPYLVLSARTPTYGVFKWLFGFSTALWLGSKGKHPSQERIGAGENQAAAGNFLSSGLKSCVHTTLLLTLGYSSHKLALGFKSRGSRLHLLMRSGKILEDSVWLVIVLWLFLENTTCRLYLSRDLFYIGGIIVYTHFCNFFPPVHISFHVSNILVQAAYKQMYFSQFWAGSSISGCRHGWVLVRALFWAADGHFLIASSQGGERVREHSGGSFIKALIPLMRASPSWPNHHWKSSPPSTITLGVRISAYEFCGDDTFSPKQQIKASFLEFVFCVCVFFFFAF